MSGSFFGLKRTLAVMFITILAMEPSAQALGMPSPQNNDSISLSSVMSSPREIQNPREPVTSTNQRVLNEIQQTLVTNPVSTSDEVPAPSSLDTPSPNPRIYGDGSWRLNDMTTPAEDVEGNEIPIGLFLKPDLRSSNLEASELMELISSAAKNLGISGVVEVSSLGTGRILFRSSAESVDERLRLWDLQAALTDALNLNVELDYELTLPLPSISSASVQTGAPWNLDRLDQLTSNLDGKYNYQLDGSGVEIWIVDSGINPDHTEYRDRLDGAWGYESYPGGPTDYADCDGHGTHVAGTALGKRYGVAKGATLKTIKILGCDGSGQLSGVIDAIDVIIANKQSEVGVVANFSLGGLFSYPAGQAAISRLISNNVTVVVAAGNETTDACNSFPANSRVGEISVGATNSQDVRAYFSNFGARCVDVYAPGFDIPSSWIGSSSATNTISGTSMASPFVAGIAARVLQGNPGASPDVVKYLIEAQASEYQSGLANDANRLAHRPVEKKPEPLGVFIDATSISKLAASGQTLSVGVADQSADVNLSWDEVFWFVSETTGLRPDSLELSIWSSSTGGQMLESCSIGFLPVERCEIPLGSSEGWVDVRISNALGWGSSLDARLEISPMPTVGDWTMIASERISSCGVLFGTDVYCWGVPFDGAGSRVSQEEYAVARSVFESEAVVTSLDLGFNHACFTLANGEAYCWGSNERGQLGQSPLTLPSSDTPIRIQDPGLVGFEKIVAGTSFTCASSSGSSSLYCWGWNGYGQLGTGDRDDRETPTLSNLTGGTSAVTFDLGDNHSCALTQSNEVRCVGADYMKASGGSGQDYLLEPRMVASGPFKYLATGADFTCVASADSAWCWGANGDAQIGQGLRGGLNGPSPVNYQSASVIANPSIRGLTAASNAACLQMTDESPICWGRNSGKFYEWNTLTWLESPISLGLDAPGKISLGSEHLCLLTEAGAVLCSGSNSWGQLGRGDLGSIELIGKVETPSAPSIPRLISAQRLDSGLAISWSPPSDLGFPLSALSYEVSVFAGSDLATPVVSCLTSQLSCDFSGLLNGQSYGVVVSSANDSGSRSSEMIFATPSTFAASPTIENISNIQGGFRVVLSEGGSNGGAEVVRFKADAFDPDSNRIEGSCEISNLSDVCIISGLRDGRFYYVYASALNDAGWGPESEYFWISAGKSLDVPELSVFIDGDGAVGETLKVDAGVWPDRPKLSYQWYSFDPETGIYEPINRATRNSYRLSSSDVGKLIYVEITVTKRGYATLTLYSTNVVGPVATGFSRAPEPTLSGIAAVDQTLTLSLGDWSPTPERFEIYWWRILPTGDVELISTIELASYTLPYSYTLQPEDINSRIEVEVVAFLENYLTTYRYAVTEPVQGKQFEFYPEVFFQGSPSPGQTLLFQAENLDELADYFYELYVGEQLVAFGLYSEPVGYLIDQADEGKSITFSVTGSKPDYSDVVAITVAGPVGKAYQNEIPEFIFIDGDGAVGETLKVDAGVWPDRPKLSYQWYSFDPETGIYEPINRATRNSYRLSSSDVGKLISVEITVTKRGYATLTLYSTNVVGPVATGFSRAPEPTLSGIAAVDQTLTLSLGDWSPTPERFEIYWGRVSPGGAYEEIFPIDPYSYTLQPEDINSRIYVDVFASLENYLTTYRYAVTEPVQGKQFEFYPEVFFQGSPSPGQTLLFQAENLDELADYFYELYVGEQLVAFGLYSEPVGYLIDQADEGKSITFSVTGSKPDYSDVVAITVAGPVGKAYQNEIPEFIFIDGDGAVGETLKVDAGVWPDRPKLSYQWYSFDPETGIYEPINRATRNSYRLSSSDVGKLIYVEITVTKRGYATLTLYSTNAVGPVGLKPMVKSVGEIVGDVSYGGTLTISGYAFDGFPESVVAFAWYLCPQVLRDPARELKITCLSLDVTDSSITLLGLLAEEEGFYYVAIEGASSSGSVTAYATSGTKLQLATLTLDVPFEVLGVVAVDWELSSSLQFLDNIYAEFTWLDDYGNLLGTDPTLYLTGDMVGLRPRLSARISQPGHSALVLEAEAPGALVVESHQPSGWMTIDGVKTAAPLCAPELSMVGISRSVVGWQTRVAYSFVQAPGSQTVSSYKYFRDGKELDTRNQTAYFLTEADVGSVISRVVEAEWSTGLSFRCLSVLEEKVLNFESVPMPRVEVSSQQASIANIFQYQGLTGEITWYLNFEELLTTPISDHVPLSINGQSGWLQALVRVDGSEISSSKISPAIFVGDPTEKLPDPYVLAVQGLSDFAPIESSIQFFFSENVPAERLAKEREQLRLAEGAWSEFFAPLGVEVLYFTPVDIDWAVNFVNDREWTAAGNLRLRLDTWGCGFALAFLVGNEQKFIQCVDDTGIGSDWSRQVGPHEYTHWVQYHIAGRSLRTHLAPYFIIEGSANFFGLALARASESLSQEFLDTTIADHASQFDLMGYGQFGNLTLMKILAEGNLLEVEAIASSRWSVFEQYAIGTLVTEWMVLELGAAGLAGFWKEFLTLEDQDGRDGPEYFARLDAVWMDNFGHSYTEIGEELLPYLSWRATQVIEAWENSLS